MRPHSRLLLARPLCVVAPAVALALVVAFLGALAPAAAEPTDSTAAARAERQRIIDYWTPQRMAQAQPRDYVRDPATGRFELASDRTAPTPNGGPNSSTERGATWTGGGLVRQTTGRVFSVINGQEGSCSASVVEDVAAETSLVLTAAHCVYDNATDTFAGYSLFVPAFVGEPLASCTGAADGCWPVQAMTVPAGFAEEDTFNDTAAMDDVAFATIGADPQGAQLDGTVGAQAIVFGRQEQGADTFLFGYPASKKYGSPKYAGETLVYSRGPLDFDARRNDQTYQLRSDLTEGSSGGPWYTPFDRETGEGATMSVTSYRYKGRPYLYGPVFGEATRALYEAADGSTAGTDGTMRTQIVP